eukprot:4797696-Prymnesium_polylepis.2
MTASRRADALRCPAACAVRAQVYLSIGSALLLPATLLAFLRPIPLPYSWAAPPEPLSRYAAIVSLAMVGALAMYHGATLPPSTRWPATRARPSEAAAAPVCRGATRRDERCGTGGPRGRPQRGRAVLAVLRCVVYGRTATVACREFVLRVVWTVLRHSPSDRNLDRRFCARTAARGAAGRRIEVPALTMFVWDRFVFRCATL